MSLSPVSDYGDLLTVDEFYELNAVGALLPYDGTGYWATKEGYDTGFDPFADRRPEWATHVMWFNC